MAKSVFTNKEIAHVWFHEYAERKYGRTSNGNMFFEGPTIYSYGKHFPMATIIELEKPLTNGKRRLVLLNLDSYSNTTTQHQYDTRAAIDDVTAERIYISGLNQHETPHRIIENYLDLVDTMMIALQHSMDCTEHRHDIHTNVLKIAEKIEILVDLLKVYRSGVRPKLLSKIDKMLATFDITEYSHYLQRRNDEYVTRYEAAERRERAEFTEKIKPIYEAHMHFWNDFRDKMGVWDDPDYLVSFLDARIKHLPRIPRFGSKMSMAPVLLDDTGVDMLLSVAQLMVTSLLREYEDAGVMIYTHNPFYLVYRYLLDNGTPFRIGANDATVERDLLHILKPIRKIITEWVINAFMTSGKVMKAAISYEDIYVLGLDESNLLSGISMAANAMIRLRQDSANEEPYIWTSKGVSMSLDEFKRYCKLLDAIEKHGLDVLPERLRRVSRSYQIHNFDGTCVTIGCHVIPWYNIRHVAKEVCGGSDGV